MVMTSKSGWSPIHVRNIVQVEASYKIDMYGPCHQVFYASCIEKLLFPMAEVATKYVTSASSSVPIQSQKIHQLVKHQSAGIILAKEMSHKSEIYLTSHNFMSHLIKTKEKLLIFSIIQFRERVCTKVNYYIEIHKREAAKKKICEKISGFPPGVDQVLKNLSYL